MNYYDTLLARNLANKGDPTIEGLSVTENGTYSEEGKAYKPVVVNVPLPSNAYLLKNASDDVISITDGEEFNLVSCDVNVDTIQSGSGDPSPENIRPFVGVSSVNVGRTDKNLFGGLDFANALSEAVEYSLDTTNKIVTFRRYSGTGNKLTLFSAFKPNTQYTIIISAYANLGTNRNTCLLIEYTDGSLDYFDIQGTTKQTYRKVTNASKSVKQFYLGSLLDSTVYAYYDECGIFEGEITAAQFEEYKGNIYKIQLGQTVYGATIDVTNGKALVNKGHIESYNGEVLPSTWLSDRDVYTSGGTPTTGAEVVYNLDTPITIQLTPTPIKLFKNNNVIYADSGDIAIEYLGKGVNV